MNTKENENSWYEGELTCHSYIATANPEAAAVPAKPINIGAPTLLANIDAPI